MVNLFPFLSFFFLFSFSSPLLIKQIVIYSETKISFYTTAAVLDFMYNECIIDSLEGGRAF